MAKSKQKPENHEAKHFPNKQIGTLGEKHLHSALKDWYAQAGDRLEAEVDGFHTDILRHNLMIEIQTSNFSSLRRKLNTLIKKHPLRLVYPIAQEKWIVRLAADGVTQLGRRKSPKKGNLFHLFEELVSIPDLIKHRYFSLEVLMVQKEEVRCDDGTGSWRRKGLSIADHHLIKVIGRHVFKQPSDFHSLIPRELPEPFSTKELGKGINQPRWLAQKMAYCLRHMGVIEIVGKNGNSILYSSSKVVQA
jgi:hypothetical protein